MAISSFVLVLSDAMKSRRFMNSSMSSALAPIFSILSIISKNVFVNLMEAMRIALLVDATSRLSIADGK